jgi:predicted nucleic-acid-binding Zn-ribbon protein
MILEDLQILYRCPECNRTITRTIQKRTHFSNIKKIIDIGHNECYYTECGVCLGTDMRIDSIVLTKAKSRNQYTTLNGAFYCLHCGHEWGNEVQLLTAILSEAFHSENFLGLETCPSCQLTEVKLISYSLLGGPYDQCAWD